jgi:formylglycine-generating enzyme required for sulfatase activity
MLSKPSAKRQADEKTAAEAAAKEKAEREAAAKVEDERKRAQAEVELLNSEGAARRKIEEATAEKQRLAMLAAEGEKKRAEAEAAKTPKPGDTFRDCPDVCPEMVVVPAGEFMMGSPSSEVRWSGYDGREEPQHKVTIAKPFAVGKFEVTREQFEAFVKSTGFAVANECYTFIGSEWKKGLGSFRKPGFDQTGSHPAVCVSWDDAKAFLAWLSKTTAKSYRLLSEAEWEYAARGGTTTPFSTGATISTEQANYNGNGNGKKGEYRKKTVEVGSFVANAFGLRDMHGNAAEWVEDSWHPNYQGAPNDGSVWPGGDLSFRVLRGGSWYSLPGLIRSASRSRNPLVNSGNTSGFRVARTL